MTVSSPRGFCLRGGANARDRLATATVNIYESGVLTRTSVLAVVFVDDSSKIRAVQESLTLPDGTPIPVVITLDGNKLFREEGD